MTEKQPYESLPKVWAWDDNKQLGQKAYHIFTDEGDPIEKFKVMTELNGDVDFYWAKNIEPYKELENKND